MDSQQPAEQRVQPEANTRSGAMWRPWNHHSEEAYNMQQPSHLFHDSMSDKMKLPAFRHPVKLFWPASKCYDYLYQEAEELLRNFPVQATISLYKESDSSASENEETQDEEDTVLHI